MARIMTIELDDAENRILAERMYTLMFKIQGCHWSGG